MNERELTWAEVCEAVSELDEPPVISCPNCHALGYKINHTYQCPRCGATEVTRHDD